NAGGREGCQASLDGGGGGRVSIEYTTSTFTGAVSVAGGISTEGPGQPGTYFLCQSSFRGACSSGASGLNLITNFSVDKSVNITRNIINFSLISIKWNDTSTNSSNIAIYNITGYRENNSYYLYRDNVYNMTLTTNSGGVLLLFNSSLNSSSHVLEVLDYAPNVTLLSPANNSYSNNSNVNFTANISDTNLKNATLNIYNSTDDLVNQTTTTFADGVVQTVVGAVITLLDGIYDWFYTIFDWAGNSFTTSNFTVTIDTTYPLIDFVSPTPANNSGITGSFDINVSITELNLANVSYNWNGTIITYNPTDNASYFSGSAPNWAFNLTQAGLVIGLSYTYNLTATDLANNINSTETRIIKGNTAPTFASVVYTPNSTDDVDPNATIVVLVNVSDVDSNFDSAILQYKNMTDSDWINISMTNTTAKSSYTILNASFLLNRSEISETNYTFRIWANDTIGDSNYSNNYTLNASWDCTWTSTSALGAISGWDENKFIGNITINNTGDSAYAVSNCSLDFRLTYDLTERRIYYDGEYLKNFKSYTVSAKSNQTVIMNATFLSEIKEESVVITIEEVRLRSTTRYRNTSATLVSNQVGPYLYQSISSNPLSVYLTDNNFSLNGYLRNLMGSLTVNVSNTAYNVSFNWTLASGLTNVSGSLIKDFVNMSNNSLLYNNIEVGFSDLAGMSSGVKTVYLYASGYNLSGGLIKDANNITLLTEIVNISFLCYNVSDGVCVASCGYEQDSDCPQATTTVSSSGAGGGGGGGGAEVESVKTAADYQLIRGEQNEVKIIFENKNKNESLKDLTFSVSGKISKYIEISPKQVSYLGPEQKITLTLTITSPTYIELGKQELIITMKGKKGAGDYTDSKKITLEIHELSIERADEMLNESRELIKQLNEANLSSEYLNKLLNESENKLAVFNLEAVRNNYKIIKEQVKYALNSNKIITELESLIESAEKKGIDVSESSKLLKLAKLSMERREFEQAYSRVKDSQLTYALEVKGEFGKLSYYIKEYPGEISLGAIFLVIFSFGSYKINRLRLVKKKIKELKEEEKILNELIRVVQKECFKDKKMGMDEYETAMKEYNKKLSEVIEGLIELEIKRLHMLRFTSKNKMLKSEKEKIINLIKELQEDYMKKKKIETRTFELKMESFNKRLGEIEEKLATLEAKKAVKGFGISLKIPREGY
ncbi:MAG: hypothetical protein ABIH37_05040, partial [archaeon]